MPIYKQEDNQTSVVMLTLNNTIKDDNVVL